MLRTSILFLSILRPKRSCSLEALSSSRGLIVLLTYGGLTPPYGFSLKDNTSLFSTRQHRPLSIFHFLENVLCLKEKYPEHSHVPFPSPNNTFTVWSPKHFFLLPEDSWTSAATSGDSRHVKRNNRNRSLDWSASIVLSLLLLHALDFVFWDISSGQPTPGNWLWWC